MKIYKNFLKNWYIIKRELFSQKTFFPFIILILGIISFFDEYIISFLPKIITTIKYYPEFQHILFFIPATFFSIIFMKIFTKKYYWISLFFPIIVSLFFESSDASIHNHFFLDIIIISLTFIFTPKANK